MDCSVDLLLKQYAFINVTSINKLSVSFTLLHSSSILTLSATTQIIVSNTKDIKMLREELKEFFES